MYYFSFLLKLDSPCLLFPCADPESFVRGGPTLTGFFLFFFLVDEGREDPNTTISEPSSSCQQNGI